MLVIYKYISSQSVANLTAMDLSKNGQNFAVIGYPVEHSLSPVLHNDVFEQSGIIAQYSKLSIEEDKLDEFVHTFRNGELRGINVTIPHKEQIIPLLDEINPRAQTIGAVNCVMKTNSTLIGYNTDWYGFSMMLKSNGIQTVGKSFFIIGAGGVSKSIVYSLIQSGANSITVTNRTIENAVNLVEQFKPICHQTELIILPFDPIILGNLNPDIIINCTSIGMSPNFSQSPIPEFPFTPNQILIDTIYNPLKTKFMKDAENVGARAMNGMDMFIYQGLASSDIWFGNDVSSVVNIQQLETKLKQSIC